MTNKDKYNQSDLTGIGQQNIGEVKDKAKAAGFINEGTYFNFNFGNFFRPVDEEAKVRSVLLKKIQAEVVERLKYHLQKNQYLELPMFSRKKAVSRSERKKIIS
ncbi:MAG: hypothetical protein F6K08_35140, partial [Okeania sp. SIO1H6]|nr:hypothetical protein [Okeania sp. SIO1H6]